MKLESIINFEVGGRVMLNPDNHGTHKGKIGFYLKVKGRQGTIIKIEKKPDEKYYLIRTGRITVRWDGDYNSRIYNYKNLIIVTNEKSEYITID